MQRFILSLKDSGPIGGLILCSVLLVFLLATIWILYVRKDKSLPSILITPFILYPILIAWVGHHLAMLDLEWMFENKGEVPEQSYAVLLSGALSSLFSMQIVLGYLVPFLVLLLIISAIISFRFGDRHWHYCIPQLAITGLSVIVLLVNMALNSDMQQGFLLVTILVLGVLGALSQTSSKKEHGTAELAFMSSIIVCIGTVFCVLFVNSGYYFNMFEDIANIAVSDQKQARLVSGLEYISKNTPFMLIIVGLSYIPLIRTSFQLTGSRSKASWLTIILIICITMGFMLYTNSDLFNSVQTWGQLSP